MLCNTSLKTSKAFVSENIRKWKSFPYWIVNMYVEVPICASDWDQQDSDHHIQLKLLRIHPYSFIHWFKKHPLISKNFGYNVTEKRLIIQWSFIQGLAEQNPKALLKRLRTANGARGNAVQSIWSKKSLGTPSLALTIDHFSTLT